MSSESTFRVIIVGGGLVGLTAAHILTKADIDFVILEQHASVAPYLGSLLSVMPTTFRVFDQVGISKPMSQVFHPAEHGFYMNAVDGSKILEEHELLEIIRTSCGYSIGLSHRATLTEALYVSLPESAKSRILLNKRVADIATSSEGIEVTCQDGTVEKGSIVIGADGVRSKVRHIMNSLRSGSSDAVQDEEKSPYISTYRNFFGDLPFLPGLVPGSNYESVHHGVSTQILVGADRAWFNVYEKLDSPTSERVRYTEKDQMQLLDKWGHLNMAPGYRLRDTYNLRSKDTGLINLEEGLVTTGWAWNRIVLVGDAVRKMTPNAGLGYNMGVSDLVVLVNGLRSLLETNKSPSTEALENSFREYELERKKDTLLTHGISMDRIRSTAWLDWKSKYICMYILPRVNLGKLFWKYRDAALQSRGPVLYWLPESNLPEHTNPYKQYPPFQMTTESIAKLQAKDSRKSIINLILKLTAGLSLAVLATAGFRFSGVNTFS